MSKYFKAGVVFLFSFALFAFAPHAGASTKTVRFALTGDLHSHFEPFSGWAGEVYPELKRGGFARIATALKNELSAANRENVPFVYIDAGDATEGGWGFVDGEVGAGEASWEALELLNPHNDQSNMIFTLGNHDWEVGPYNLGRVLKKVKPSFPILAGNLSFEDNRINPSGRIAYALEKFHRDDLVPFHEDFSDYTQKFVELFFEGFEVPNDAKSEKNRVLLQNSVEQFLELINYMLQISEDVDLSEDALS
ncbi:metallophosphoesterase, partial [Bdellovibrionota bacterium]